jgi:cysteinyl-tRNA synthetase
MDTLYIYNTLNRKKEKFEPLAPGFVGIYVCGPTVYDHSHLGHAKSYISFDVIVRYLRFVGYKVRYVQNITDVGHLQGDAEEGEDKVSKQARLQKLEPMEIAEKYTHSYFEDMDRLGNLPPDISPRASGHIIEQIDFIKTLIEKGYAYEASGNVYFDVRKFSGYGKLSGRKIEELEAGARVEVAEDKKYPADFALWKKATPEHIMQWNSPWGRGYPGWHIECSSMSMKYLGETIDIHGGGLENVFPHHECEIAQNECAFDKPFVKYWLHNNMITVDGVKMGKSLNNFITIKEALKKHDPLAIRYFILMSHYRSALDFSETALDAASAGLKKIINFLNRIHQELENMGDKEGTVSLPVAEFDNKFRAAMNDDFNTPQALAAVFELINDGNKILDDRNQCVAKTELVQVKQILQSTLGDVLGIITAESGEQETSRQDFDHVMDILLEVRKDLRMEKNFKITDKIRDMLKSHGILLKDTPQGATWERNLV